MPQSYEDMLSEEQIEFVKNHANPGLKAADLADMFNRRFGTSFSHRSMQSIRQRFVPGFKFANIFPKRTNYENVFTSEQQEFIRRLTRPDITLVELCQQFNQQFGISISRGTMSCVRRRFTPEFKIIGEENMRVLAHKVAYKRRKPEQIAHGYTYVWDEDNKLTLKHLVVWKKHYGHLPPGFSVVFLDGAKTNFDISNLIAVQKGIMIFMNSKKIPLSILADKDALKAVLTMQQICRRSSQIKRYGPVKGAKVKTLEPLYQPVGRPGFAF